MDTPGATVFILLNNKIPFYIYLMTIHYSITSQTLIILFISGDSRTFTHDPLSSEEPHDSPIEIHQPSTPKKDYTYEVLQDGGSGSKMEFGLGSGGWRKRGSFGSDTGSTGSGSSGDNRKRSSSVGVMSRLTNGITSPIDRKRAASVSNGTKPRSGTRKSTQSASSNNNRRSISGLDNLKKFAAGFFKSSSEANGNQKLKRSGSDGGNLKRSGSECSNMRRPGAAGNLKRSGSEAGNLKKSRSDNLGSNLRRSGSECGPSVVAGETESKFGTQKKSKLPVLLRSGSGNFKRSGSGNLKKSGSGNIKKSGSGNIKRSGSGVGITKSSGFSYTGSVKRSGSDTGIPRRSQSDAGQIKRSGSEVGMLRPRAASDVRKSKSGQIARSSSGGLKKSESGGLKRSGSGGIKRSGSISDNLNGLRRRSLVDDLDGSMGSLERTGSTSSIRPPKVCKS